MLFKVTLTDSGWFATQDTDLYWDYDLEEMVPYNVNKWGYHHPEDRGVVFHIPANSESEAVFIAELEYSHYQNRYGR